MRKVDVKQLFKMEFELFDMPLFISMFILLILIKLSHSIFVPKSHMRQSFYYLLLNTDESIST